MFGIRDAVVFEAVLEVAVLLIQSLNSGLELLCVLESPLFEKCVYFNDSNFITSEMLLNQSPTFGSISSDGSVLKQH